MNTTPKNDHTESTPQQGGSSHRQNSGHELCDAVTVFTDQLASQDPDARVAINRGSEIANIVGELGVGDQMRAGAQLFPLLKLGAISKRAIEKQFGQPLAGLVSELVKLSDFGLTPNWTPGTALGDRQIDALRKMLLAIADDVRLVLVRIAEQLFRLREAKDAPGDVRRQAALETREIFAPLASRLGIWQIKWELEDLSFRFLEPEQYKRIAGWLDGRRADREAYINNMVASLHDVLAEANIEAVIAGRPKHIYSIWKKMQHKHLDFEQLFDVRAVRILLDSVADCYTALGLVHGKWKYIPGEFDDYIATPKENKYQSLHTAVIGPDRKIVEIQIRTHDMHAHAELGVAAHWTYKEGSSADPSYHKKINWLRSILEPADEDSDEGEDNIHSDDRDKNRDQDFIDRFKAEIFEDRVYAMTPAGDVVDLPHGSTPLDLAYYVHTNLGHCCRGAKIGGRIVPLTHQLENGDIVEIISSKTPKPSRDWLIPQLGYLASTRARSKVRVWFRRQDQEHIVAQGQALLEKEIKHLGVNAPHVTELAKLLQLDSATGLYAALGNGDITIHEVIRAIQKVSTPRVADRELPTAKQSHKQGKGQDVRISGVGDLLTMMARCCKPVPPDPVTGYITLGRGVTIHRQDCGNMLRLVTSKPERILEVDWTAERPDKYPVDIQVEAYDRDGLLKDITALLSMERVSITNINMHKDDQGMEVRLNLTLEITGLEELSQILHKLKNLPNIFKVERQ